MPALCSWYFSGISRTEARQLLLSPANAPGAFLIRPSESSQGDYSLSGTRVAPGDPVPRRRPAQPNQPGTLLTAGRLRPRQCQPLAHAGPHVGPRPAARGKCPLSPSLAPPPFTYVSARPLARSSVRSRVRPAPAHRPPPPDSVTASFTRQVSLCACSALSPVRCSQLPTVAARHSRGLQLPTPPPSMCSSGRCLKARSEAGREKGRGGPLGVWGWEGLVLGLHLCPLAVRAQARVRPYRTCTAADGSLHLQKGRRFPSLEELLTYYQASWKRTQNPLLQPCVAQVGCLPGRPSAVGV